MASTDQSHYRVRKDAAKAASYRIRLDDLERWVASMLAATGLTADDAGLVAAALVEAEGRGVSSHGVARTRIYSERIRAGLIDARARPEVVKETAATAHIDAHSAVGPVGGQAGLQAAIDKATAEGAGVSLVRESNHCGALAFYVRRATAQGLIAIMATNGPPVMVYFGGKTRAVGTNPLGIGVPRSDGPPLVLDMATSATARGRVILAGQTGQPIPEGWAVDVDGVPTTDAERALQGAVVPFAGPKGSGLAMMLDLLCGGLAAGITGEQIGDMYEDFEHAQRVSHLVMVLNPDAWLGGDAFRDHVAKFAARVGDLPPAEGSDKVYLPGEIEERAWQAARREGVTLSGHVFEDLQDLSQESDVTVPDAEALAADGK